MTIGACSFQNLADQFVLRRVKSGLREWSELNRAVCCFVYGSVVWTRRIDEDNSRFDEGEKSRSSFFFLCNLVDMSNYQSSYCHVGLCNIADSELLTGVVLISVVGGLSSRFSKMF